MAKHPAVKTKAKKTKKLTPPAIAPAPLDKNPHAQALGRLGGSQNTPAQVKARLKNAKRAGRPGRVCIHCGEPVRGGHQDPKLDATCHARAWTWAEPKNRREPK